MSGKPLFIVWYKYSRRMETMAGEMDGQISFQYEARLEGRWLKPLRYLVQGWKTWRLLERQQPEFVVVQSPPIFAPLMVAAWCWLRGKTGAAERRTLYAIDAHTGSFYHPEWSWALPLLRVLARGAAVTLVTNESALSMLQSWGARSLFLIDGLPKLHPPAGLAGSEGEARVAVIGVFSIHEPIEEFFAAARLLPQVTFYLTGDPKVAASRLLEQKPENVVLTGFLRGGNYTALLKNVHGLVVLTKVSDDLSCAAYEALAMAKPAVVSEGREMRRFFARGFIHVRNTPADIAAGIKEMLEEREMLTDEVIAQRAELEAARRTKFEEFISLIKGEPI